MIAFDPKKSLKEHEERAIAAIDECVTRAKDALKYNLDRVRDALGAVAAQAVTDPKAVVFAAVLPLNINYQESFRQIEARFGNYQTYGNVVNDGQDPISLPAGRYAVVITLEKLPTPPDAEDPE